ncbi:hypothetical protein [Kumtagia ephedrae]|uniref:hypothetical protein n=1 Tax=Kumtagia ephedrae TaxID=2116701 RepID=UPI001FDF5C99|nr:hypothetical protein [Mesorhizobium ephedrae]
MRTYAEQRAMLARMEGAKAEAERHLAIIERQIVTRAERATINNGIKSRLFGRFSSNWSRADERDCQENVAILRLARRRDRCAHPQAGAAGRSHRRRPHPLSDR